MDEAEQSEPSGLSGFLVEAGSDWVQSPVISRAPETQVTAAAAAVRLHSNTLHNLKSVSLVACLTLVM